MIGSFVTTMYPLMHHLTFCAVFLWNIKSPRWLRAPCRPDLAPCDFWLFPKLKSPLKRKRFQTVSKIQENTMDSWWWLGELCEVPTCLLWGGLRHHCPTYNVSCIFFNKCLYFSCYITGYLVDRPHHMHIHLKLSLCFKLAFVEVLINKKIICIWQ